MKKNLIMATAMLLCSTSISAQDFKSFVSDINYDVTVGFSTTVCNEHYDNAKAGLTIGIDARKPILHYPNEASTIYGLVGLHYIKKGGKTTTDISQMFESGVNLVSNHVQLPIHPGFSYQFKKFSLYIDLGPYIGIKVSEDGENDKNSTELSSTEIGYGVNLGIRFKRFAIGFGSEQGLTKFATYIDPDDGEINLKNRTGHFDLKWTF